MKCSNKYFGKKVWLSCCGGEKAERQSVSQPSKEDVYLSQKPRQNSQRLYATVEIFESQWRHVCPHRYPKKNCRHILFKCSLLLAFGPRVGFTETNLKNRIQRMYFKINIGALLHLSQAQLFSFYSPPSFLCPSLSGLFCLPGLRVECFV